MPASLPEIHAALTAPGAPFEIAETEIRGIPTRIWKNAPAAPELVRRIKQAFPGVSPGNGYGLTETSSVTTFNAADDYVRKPDSVGAPVPVCELKIVGDDGSEVAPGGLGEIWIKGPNVVTGYLEIRDTPLPRNANGKILKRELRDALAARVGRKPG